MASSETQPIAIFDFDGTLVDSKEGILNCLKRTLRRRGLPWQEPLDWFVGPPAHVSMPQLLPFAGVEEHAEIVAEYRGLYAESGWSQSALYPGVREMLQSLHQSGWRLFVCTAKREEFTGQMLQHFEIEEYFEAVYADSGTLSSHSKAELLEDLIREQGVPAHAVIIGDRVFDVEAGKQCGIQTIAVTYGYGSREELNACRPDWLCNSTAEVLRVLLERESRRVEDE